MKYEYDEHWRYVVPIVHCGNCGSKMLVDDIDGRGNRAIFYMNCSNEQCRSWCRIRNGVVLDYGISED